MIRIITIEREYGCGAGGIAKSLADRLGWSLWDHEITCEIAKRMRCDVASVERREERPDPAFYRLVKVFMRGSYEDRYSGSGVELLDAEHLAEIFESVVKDVAERGPCVIVGRGSPWFLRGRDDAMHTFLFAPYEEKMRRTIAQGKTEEEAEDLIERVDRDRAAFVCKFVGKTWPQRDLYHLMINSIIGDEGVIEIMLHELELLNRQAAQSLAPAEARAPRSY
ncbi:MAG: cytidylate kinase-like family protein [Acidobacteriaceae bacterium]|nr:cytidylate kinase-like family protein [Acidobacteriaceae bacterium]